LVLATGFPRYPQGFRSLKISSSKSKTAILGLKQAKKAKKSSLPLVLAVFKFAKSQNREY
jgi:hypothetical protein